ncbi:MAG TPA: hypothetical protein VFZ91_04095 [Allosphingosinicella sp.]
MDFNISQKRPSRRRVEDLHAQLNELLESLDHAELHGAAAYVSMALDTMRRDYPGLSATH